MKKYLTMFLCCLMLCQNVAVFAAETDGTYEMIETNEIYEMEHESEVAPYLLHIADISTAIVKKSSSSVGIRAEAMSIDKVKSITVTYTLQKLVGGTWKDYASKTATAYDAYSAYKSYTITGLSSGSYRTKATAVVTDYNGYKESLTGCSSSISL